MKEHIGPFLLGFSTLTFILVMNRIFVLVWDIVGKGIKITTVLNLLFLSLPFIIALTVPMAVLVASLMAFGRLSQDNELVAMSSCGVNSFSLTIFPFILSIFVTVFMIWFNDRVLPESNHKLKNLVIDIAQRKPIFRLKALVTIKDFDEYDIQVSRVDYKNSMVKGIKIFEKTNPPREIFARQGKFFQREDCIIMELFDGEFHELDREQPTKYKKLKFEKHTILFPIDTASVRRNRTYRGDRELSCALLRKKINDLRLKKESKHSKARINRLLVEYHKKFSIPFACIIFVFMGFSVAKRFRKSSGAVGFAISLFFFIFYYACLLGGEELGDRGIIVPWLAMWFPNIVLGIMSIYLCWRER